MKLQISPPYRSATALVGFSTGIILCLIGICLLVYQSITRSAVGKVRVGEVSQRSSEFIADEKGKGGTVWNGADLEGATKVESNVPYTRPCYQVRIPFVFIQTKAQRQSDPCVLEGRVVSPPAHLVIGATIYSGELNEFSGIAHRNRNPDLYTKESLAYTNTQIAESVTYSEAEGMTAFLLAPPYVLTVAFSGMSQAELLRFEDMKQLISTITITQPTTSPTITPSSR